jgi:TolA-binding protein
MKQSLIFLSIITLCTSVLAGPILEMNRAFNALSDLVPYLTNREKFMDKKNEPFIDTKMEELKQAFKLAKHEPLLKTDLFAPSYALINENIAESQKAFKTGHKDYSYWRLKEITSRCIDCHTSMPISHSSSFQNGELAVDVSKYENAYNLGLAQIIVRRYADAKQSFTKDVDDKFIKNQPQEVLLPLKQLVLIETKVLKNPQNIQSTLKQYQLKKNLPQEVKSSIDAWLVRLKHWEKNPVLTKKLHTNKEVEAFIKNEMEPLQKRKYLDQSNEIDLLFSSGLLSNFLFENPNSKKVPEISYWLGWTEKRLKRESFFGSGDLFFKQCIKRYPKHPIAKKCFEEYKESVEFDFSGSDGLHIPADVQNEMDDLNKLIKKK